MRSIRIDAPSLNLDAAATVVERAVESAMSDGWRTRNCPTGYYRLTISIDRLTAPNS